MKILSAWLIFCLLNFCHAAGNVQQELVDLKQKFTQSASEEKREAYEKGIQYVADSGIVNAALQLGDKAPDFILPNASGDTIHLTALLTNGPVILVWYRGGWCPYCNIYLRGLQQRLPEIHAAGAQLVAITPELPDNALDTQDKHNLAFHVLSDVGNQVASDYGVVFTLPDYVVQHYDLSFSLPEYNGDHSYTLPLAASYVIDNEGIVSYAYLDPDYRNRAPIDDLIDAVNNKQIN